MRKRLKMKQSRIGLHDWRWTYRSPYPKRLHMHQSPPVFRKVFKDWLRENASSLAVPVKIIGRYRDGYSLQFIGYPDCISIWAKPDEIAVIVKWEGMLVDFLLDADMSIPIASHGPIFCEACVPDMRVHYPNLREYWRGHQFDTFKEWIAKRLAPATWLEITERWAEFRDSESKGGEVLASLPLRSPCLREAGRAG